jgi:3-oxoacyl-[acyl-carrier protein] reductase/bacilysin biosynthesis oxidoreductase BacG
MDLQLSGKSVLVTGGSRGIGRQIALAFAAEGARVAICSRGEAALQTTAGEIRALGAECLILPADLTEAAACQGVIDKVTAAFGGIDILVNNAGANVDSAPSKLADASDDQIMSRVGGKALAAIRLSRAVLPYMQSAHSGRIIFIAGTSARMVMRGRERPSTEGNPMVSGLGNAMITNFAKMLGEQVIKDGVLVNVIHPHITRTDRHPARIKRRAAEMGTTEAEAEADLATYLPIGRVVEPTDIAPLVVLLASPVNGAITGQAITVDGGAYRGINY